ncbi:MAG: hypothetical protein K0U72_03605 [Gammaproteobacteria bacterium]|nr:hypothetical protein [Gammaproteobacteria bacterium]
MGIDLKAALKNKALNGYRLFFLVSIPMSIVMLVAASGVDLSTGPGVSAMIGFSVRFAVPIVFLVVAISSLQKLFPGPIPAWLLRNRKYIGLCFAVAMAWQGLFISMMSLFFRDYYFADIYLLRDELEGSVGYIFLTGMVVTSFDFARRRLSAKQWKLLHKTGLYFLFAYPFSVYWWNLSYYPNPEPIDYVFYWSGFVAFTLRIAAWGKQRLHAAHMRSPESRTPFALKALGTALVMIGIVAAANGRNWQDPVTNFLTSPQWSADLVLWLPYWPLEPYLPLFIIALGTMLLTKVKGWSN